MVVQAAGSGATSNGAKINMATSDVATGNRASGNGATSRRPVLARKVLALLVAPVVIAAGIILYLYPSQTAQLFAWPIAPTMTPIVMGAGYLAAAWFFFSLWRARAWAHVAAVLSGIFVFTVVMLVSTLLHWDRFSHGKFTFWLWLVVYVLSPFAVAGVIWLHRHHREPQLNSVIVNPIVRGWFTLLFAAMAIVALALVLWPSSIIGLWPWKLSPLTARVLGGWIAVLAVGGLQMCRSAQWLRWPVALETGALWFSLIALALPGARGDFASQQGFVGFATVLAVLWLSFVGMWIYYQRKTALKITR